jgi:hypothetical protein
VDRSLAGNAHRYAIQPAQADAVHGALAYARTVAEGSVAAGA